MKLNKILKIVISSLLLVCFAFVLFGCNGKKREADPLGKLPQQKENLRYYFQQGYRTDWAIIESNADDFMIDRETGLVMVLAPVTTEETTNDDGTKKVTHTAIEGVEYCIYYYGGEGIYMTTSRSDIVSWMQDEDSDFFFNKKHYRSNPRETFLQIGEAETTTAQYSKLQFSSIRYSFTKDGVEYEGVMNLVMSGMEYFIVTYEARADLYEAYKADYDETIGDFRKRGWETSDVG